MSLCDCSTHGRVFYDPPLLVFLALWKINEKNLYGQYFSHGRKHNCQHWPPGIIPWQERSFEKINQDWSRKTCYFTFDCRWVRTGGHFLTSHLSPLLWISFVKVLLVPNMSWLDSDIKSLGMSKCLLRYMQINTVWTFIIYCTFHLPLMFTSCD